MLEETYEGSKRVRFITCFFSNPFRFHYSSLKVPISSFQDFSVLHSKFLHLLPKSHHSFLQRVLPFKFFKDPLSPAKSLWMTNPSWIFELSELSNNFSLFFSLPVHSTLWWKISTQITLSKKWLTYQSQHSEKS